MCVFKYMPWWDKSVYTVRSMHASVPFQCQWLFWVGTFSWSPMDSAWLSLWGAVEWRGALETRWQRKLCSSNDWRSWLCPVLPVEETVCEWRKHVKSRTKHKALVCCWAILFKSKMFHFRGFYINTPLSCHWNEYKVDFGWCNSPPFVSKHINAQSRPTALSCLHLCLHCEHNTLFPGVFPEYIFNQTAHQTQRRIFNKLHGSSAPLSLHQSPFVATRQRPTFASEGTLLL